MKIFVMVLLFSLFTSNLHAGEMETRQQIQLEALKAFNANDFQLLEDISRHYRDDEERTESGLWKLGLFYKAFVNASLPEDDSYFDFLVSKTASWMQQYPDSPTPYIVQGIIRHKQGDMHIDKRSGELVSKENYETYLKYSHQAKDFLLKNKVIGSKDPHWYNVLANIYKGIGIDKDSYKELIDEGTNKYPYYYEIYFAAADYYSPRWHGSMELLEEFAKSSIEKTKEREGLGMYSRIYWSVPSDSKGRKLLIYPSVDWELLTASMDDVLKRYPDQWNINNFAFFACQKGDVEKTRELINRIENQPIYSAWYSKGNFGYCESIM